MKDNHKVGLFSSSLELVKCVTFHVERCHVETLFHRNLVELESFYA